MKVKQLIEQLKKLDPETFVEDHPLGEGLTLKRVR